MRAGDALARFSNRELGRRGFTEDTRVLLSKLSKRFSSAAQKGERTDEKMKLLGIEAQVTIAL